LIRIGGQGGFTLVEMLIVLGMMAAIVGVTLPLLDLGGGPAPRQELNALNRLLFSLKHRAVQEEKTVFLHISPSGRRLWLTDSSMDASAKKSAMDTSVETFEAIQISRVEIFGTPDREPQTIRFFKKGYSDLAILKVEGLEAPVILKLEPFLPRPLFLPVFVDLNACT